MQLLLEKLSEAQKDMLEGTTCSLFRGSEEFQHDLHITTGLVQAVELPSDGNAVLTEGDRIYMALHNRGHRIVYVSVFNVSPAGEIFLISVHHHQ